jgi:hypothetical protein
MRRGLVGLTFATLLSAGPAAAMDQSAQEETNCLMACDANQQNCQANAHMPAAAHGARAGLAPEAKAPRGLRPAANYSQVDRGALSAARLR